MTNKQKNSQSKELSLRPGGPRGPMEARINKEKPKNTRKTLTRILSYIGRNKFILFALIGFMLCVTVIDVLGPMFQQKAIDTISFKEGRLQVDFAGMRFYLLIMITIFIISGIMTYFQGVLSAKLSQSTVYAMRKDLFAKISRLPIKYTDTHKHGDIMSRMTNDVENVSNAIAQSITSLISATFTVLGVFCMMLFYNWVMTLVAILTIPVTLFVSKNLAKFMRKYFIKQQRLLGQINGQVEEMITGYKTVVSYGKENDAVKKFGEISEELRKCSISARVWGSIMGPVMNFIGNFQYVLLASVGGFMMIKGYSGMTIGKIQAMLQYSKQFSRPINMIANQYSAILTALAGAERIFDVMDSENEIDEGKEQISIENMQGNIEFKNIYFGYAEGEPVLKNLSLSVKSGEKIAIVGSTGSGKTTIVNLLTRFYELDGGSISIDGVDITDIPKDTLRKAIAIVLQDTVLFNDTIRTNIKYGRLEADDEAMRAAAHTAMADRFIDRLPEGYDTMLSEAGSNLSQGQRQLLSIARAVLAEPKILILDEATSSVDTRTEMHIQQAMVNLMKGRTSLIIAHRLSTIRDADMIVVLNDGMIVEMGNHDELLEKKGQYFKLYSKQFAGQET